MKDIVKASEENDSWIYEVCILQHGSRGSWGLLKRAYYKTFYSSFTKFKAIMKNANKATSFREHTVFRLFIVWPPPSQPL